MPTSTFEVAVPPQLMDSVSPTFSAPNWNVGLFFSGGSKAFSRRTLARYDLNSPASGDPIIATDTILDARLELNVTSHDGGLNVNVPHTIDRITRNDWDADASWNNYKSANTWTAPGGDTATPPDAVHFTGPAAAGALVISGAALATMLEWFVDNNSGLVQLRIRMDNEANNGVTRWWAVTGGSRLFVTTPDTIQQPIDTPRGDTLATTRPGRSPGAAAAAGAAPPARPARAARGNHG